MKLNFKKTIKALFFLLAVFSQVKCSSSNDAADPGPVLPPVVPPVVVTNDVDFWLTKGDQSVLLAKQSGTLGFGTTYNIYPNIEVNASQKYQTSLSTLNGSLTSAYDKCYKGFSGKWYR